MVRPSPPDLLRGHLERFIGGDHRRALGPALGEVVGVGGVGVAGDQGEDLGARIAAALIDHQRLRWAGLCLVGLALVLVLAVITLLGLVLGYRSRWQRARRRTLKLPRDEAALAALVAGGETDHLEFKSTMRWNLHQDKPGKEIELAWLKSVVAYLNTDGGIILLGVGDDGEVVGGGAAGHPDRSGDLVELGEVDEILRSQVELLLHGHRRQPRRPRRLRRRRPWRPSGRRRWTGGTCR
mgnify:CR=1 FL=1